MKIRLRVRESLIIIAIISKKTVDKVMMLEMEATLEFHRHSRTHKGFCYDQRLEKIQIKSFSNYPFRLLGNFMDMHLLVLQLNIADILHLNKVKNHVDLNQKYFRVKDLGIESFKLCLQHPKRLTTEPTLETK